jgi:hypothetical protein
MKLIFIALSTITFMIFLLYRWSRKNKKQLTKSFQKAFGSLGVELPQLKISSSYGYPTYSISFQNHTDFLIAEKNGANKAFKEEIEKIHSPEIKDFNVDLAVHISYIE